MSQRCLSNQVPRSQGGERGRFELVTERLGDEPLAGKQWLAEDAESRILARRVDLGET